MLNKWLGDSTKHVQHDGSAIQIWDSRGNMGGAGEEPLLPLLVCDTMPTEELTTSTHLQLPQTTITTTKIVYFLAFV